MTEAEIMKALECCLKTKTMGDCEDMNCPAFTKCGCSYVLRTDEDFEGLVYCEMLKDALDLINRKNAEIEKSKHYKSFYEDLKAEHIETIKAIRQNEKATRTEAIKEFAERAMRKKRSITVGHGITDYVVDEFVFAEIAKEMGVKL